MILSGNIHASSEAVRNSDFLDSICASLAYAFGIEPTKYSVSANKEIVDYIEKYF